jgi:hypothetical protein
MREEKHRVEGIVNAVEDAAIEKTIAIGWTFIVYEITSGFVFRFLRTISVSVDFVS